MKHKPASCLRVRLLLGVACLCFAVAAPAGRAQTTERGTTQATVMATTPGTSRVASGIQVKVRINQSLSSKTAGAGTTWSGQLATDLIIAGRLTSPAGTQVTGTVSESVSAARGNGIGTLALRLTSVRGTGISSQPLVRKGTNPGINSTGSVADAGIPGEAAQSGAGITPTTPATISEARVLQGSVLTFTTE